MLKKMSIKSKFTKKIVLSFLTIFIILLSYSFYKIFIYNPVPSTFLPDSSIEFEKAAHVRKINSDYYSVFLNTHLFNLKDNRHNILIENLIYYINYNYNSNAQEEFITLSNYTVEGSKDSQIVHLYFNTEPSDIHIELLLKKESNKIEFIITSQYKKAIEVIREALVFKFSGYIQNIYTKNKQVVKNDFEDEYWVNKGGVKFGSKENSSIIYHNIDISSLQIDTINKLLWVNLDYENDHPFIHLLKGKGGEYLDLSPSKYDKNDVLTRKFTLFTGIKKQPVTRILNAPFGYNSVFIWTEHADNTVISTNKAVYFGSEKIDNPQNAVGGFVKHHIPVTKSVFYSNINDLRNTDFNEDFNEPQLSIKGNGEYMRFLSDLYRTGLYEICLHSSDPGNVSKANIDSALIFMHNIFNTVTWIDHGMSDGFSKRESFAADAFFDNEYNIVDEWSKYDIKYFWNCAEEKISGCSSLKKKVYDWDFLELLRCLKERSIGNFDLLKSEAGQHIPSPVYWQHPTRTQKFYSWSTLNSAGHLPGWVWDYKFSIEKLDELVKNRGIAIIHFYPAFVGKTFGYDNGIWIEEENEIVINEDFENMLKRMAKYRDAGKIYFTTIKNYLDYQIKLENIELNFLPGNSLLIINNNDEEIKGLSFAVECENLIIDRLGKNYKKDGDDLIFWININANDTITILGIEDFLIDN